MRTAILETAIRCYYERMRAESESLANDCDDRAEMKRVAEEMDQISVR